MVGETTLTPAPGTTVDANGAARAPVAPLGQAGIVAAAPAEGSVTTKPAAAGAAAVSRDTIASSPENNAAALAADAARLAKASEISKLEKAIAANTDPAAKTRLEAELAKLKPAADDAVQAAAIAAAEKVLADAKTPEEKAAAQAALDKLKAPVSLTGAPAEGYTEFKLPPGFTPDPAALAAVTPLMKELNLSQAGAEKLLAFEAGRIKAAAEAAGKNHVGAWNKLMGDRLTAAKNDPEVGGSGNPDVFAKTIADARAGIKAFGTPALQAYLNTSEAGSHVEVIRALAAAGRAVSNDTVHLGGAAVKAEPKTLADRLFPQKAATK
jgi:hypothetical protein